MPSDKHNSITAMAKGLIFSLFNVTLAGQCLLAYHTLYNVCFMDLLSSVLLCVPSIFADSVRCRFVVAPHDGFPTLM